VWAIGVKKAFAMKHEIKSRRCKLADRCAPASTTPMTASTRSYRHCVKGEALKGMELNGERRSSSFGRANGRMSLPEAYRAQDCRSAIQLVRRATETTCYSLRARVDGAAGS